MRARCRSSGSASSVARAPPPGSAAPSTPAKRPGSAVSRASPPGKAARVRRPGEDALDDPAASPLVRRHAFVAPAPARWRERYAPACAACESARVPCAHLPEPPLRLLVIGHNPSTHSWASGWSYSNPSNNFWKLLARGDVVPEHWTAEDCPRLPAELGVGFTDAGCVPGNDAGKYGRAEMRAWRDDLFARLRGHLLRASGFDFDRRLDGGWVEEEEEVGGARAEDPGSDAHLVAAVRAASRDGFGPAIVAFAGKRQYAQLFDSVRNRSTRGGRTPRRFPRGPLDGPNGGVGAAELERARGDDQGGAGGAPRRARETPEPGALAERGTGSRTMTRGARHDVSKNFRVPYSSNCSRARRAARDKSDCQS